MKNIDLKSTVIAILFIALVFVSISATEKTDKWDDNQVWIYDLILKRELKEMNYDYLNYFNYDNPDDEEQLKVGKPDVDTAYILPSGWEVIGRDTGLRDYLEIRKRIK